MAGFNKPSKQNKRLTESKGTKNIKNIATNGNLSDRGYSNSRRPTSQPTVKSSGINQTSLGNPKGLRDLEKGNTSSNVKTSSHGKYYNTEYGSKHVPTPTKIPNSNLTKRGYPSSTNPSSQPSTKKNTNSNMKDRGYPSSTNPSSQPKKRSDITKRSGGGITDTSVNKGTNATPKNNVGDILRKGFTEVQTPTAKKRWNKEEVMKERREAALAKKKAEGKSGFWNKEEELKKRRKEALENGKGTWNKEEAMKKRREEAMQKKKGK